MKLIASIIQYMEVLMGSCPLSIARYQVDALDTKAGVFSSAAEGLGVRRYINYDTLIDGSHLPPTNTCKLLFGMVAKMIALQEYPFSALANSILYWILVLIKIVSVLVILPPLLVSAVYVSEGEC
jgi:hypothetical protein